MTKKHFARSSAASVITEVMWSSLDELQNSRSAELRENRTACETLRAEDGAKRAKDASR